MKLALYCGFGPGRCKTGIIFSVNYFSLSLVFLIAILPFLHGRLVFNTRSGALARTLEWFYSKDKTGKKFGKSNVKLIRHFPFKLCLWGVQVGIFTSFLLFNLTWFNFAWNNHNKTGYFVWSICLLGSLRQTTWNGSRVERKIKISKTACLKPLLRSKFSKFSLGIY